jgi:hypothetical protein
MVRPDSPEPKTVAKGLSSSVARIEGNTIEAGNKQVKANKMNKLCAQHKIELKKKQS